MLYPCRTVVMLFDPELERSDIHTVPKGNKFESERVSATEVNQEDSPPRTYDSIFFSFQL